MPNIQTLLATEFKLTAAQKQSCGTRQKNLVALPTFWQGRNLIHFAAQKDHLGIYLGAEAMKHFAPRLTEYKTSKGAIRFPYKSFGAEQIKLITEIAAWRGKENAKI